MEQLQKEKYIRRTFELAKKGMGKVSPNPLVGAVLVKDGKIISEGYHHFYGGDHAEKDAINNSTVSVEGSVLFCNLEPCCHTNKQTPPCTNFIIENKISKVVISNLDPNPEVSGKGLKQLENAGIEVEYGILEKEGLELNEVFFKWIKNNTPFIHIKLAQTLDGRICTQTGNSKWISDESARTYAHELRLKYDAVLVGSNTFHNDNPSLSIRMGINSKGKTPFRIILGNPNSLNVNLKLLSDSMTEKTIIAFEDDILINDESKTHFLNNNIILLPYLKGNLDNLLFELGKLGISSVLVEGGSKVISSFIKNNAFDKISVITAPIIMGNGPSFFEDDSKSEMSDAFKLNNLKTFSINNQVVWEGYR